jgi:hypothetical protein
MEPMKTAPVINLSDMEQKMLEAWSRGGDIQARRVLRAKFVLLAVEGRTNETIATDLGTSKPTVGRRRIPMSLAFRARGGVSGLRF